MGLGSKYFLWSKYFFNRFDFKSSFQELKNMTLKITAEITENSIISAGECCNEIYGLEPLHSYVFNQK